MPKRPDTPQESAPLPQERGRAFPWWIVLSATAGLLTAEAVATLHVYFSNRDLHRTVTAILDAGYLAVPNEHVIPTLLSPKTALCSGIFYTLSVGAALVTLSLVLAWAWDRFFHRDRRALVSPMILWAAGSIGANFRGFAPLDTAYFLLIPPATFITAVCLMTSQRTAHRRNREWLIHPVALILLAALGASQMEAEVFTRFRNRCLLGNPAGLAVNDFYYRYTLYAARSFKSLDQRLLNICHVQTGTPALSRRIESRLARYDYLSIPNRPTAGLRIQSRHDAIQIEVDGHPVTRVSRKQFFDRTRTVLDDVSRKTDRHGFLRWFTYISLIGESLILLYLFVSVPVQMVLRRFLSPFAAKSASAAVCLIICGAFFQFLPPRPTPDVGTALASNDPEEQAMALETITDGKREIADFPFYVRLLESPHIAVRYRLARALGVSRTSRTYPHLLTLLDDDSVTVVYQAYWGLGRRGRREAIPRIQAGIASSDHWYVQTYAYTALRRLGWKQTVSR